MSLFAPTGSFGSVGAYLPFFLKDAVQTEFFNGFHCVWSYDGEMVERNKDC